MGRSRVVLFLCSSVRSQADGAAAAATGALPVTVTFSRHRAMKNRVAAARSSRRAGAHGEEPECAGH